MRVDLFDFDLPEDRIALRPASPRDSARLLVVGNDSNLQDRRVTDLPGLLRPGDALVFNDSRVIPARLHGIRRRGDSQSRIEATLHQRTGDDRWRAFVKPAKRLREGDLIAFGAANGAEVLTAEVATRGEAGEVLLLFDRSGEALDAALHCCGEMPLPPYIAAKRAGDARDLDDYQTIYAREEGAVAAPTAGLHFTPQLLQGVADAGISCHFVTLHVGAGTFLPVKAEDTRDHRMHGERGAVSAATAAALNEVRARGGRIVAVGTTSLRLLESAAREDGTLAEWAGETEIFMTPGHAFRTATVLMTNFHLPRSTLFMLVSAFSGLETMRKAYRHAIEQQYRFYSYGDACLLFRSA